MSTALKSHDLAYAVRRISELFARCEIVGECFVWQGCKKGIGYPQFSWRGFKDKPRTHRFFYEVMRGPIPKGLFVCHRCDNGSCLNIEHLHLGTPMQNSVDALVRRRQFWRKKTHCPSGHAYSGENLKIRMRNGRAHRVCIACIKLKNNNRSVKNAKCA